MPEERCQELAEMMDKLSKQEKEFVLWFILPEIIEMLKANEPIAEHAKPREVYASFMAQQERQTLERLREVMGYDLW